MITVIIPVFNAEKYLEECLLSITAQTYRDFEIIAINDGSTDESLKILRKFAKDDRRLRIISQGNAGVSMARNRGIKAAKGEYILFIDADDYLLGADALEKMVRVSLTKPELIFFRFKFEHKKAHSKLAGGLYSSTAERAKLYSKTILDEQLNSPCTKLYRKDIIEKHQLYFEDKLELGEDLLFNIKYIAECKNVYYMTDCLYFYRTSNVNSATSKFKSNKHDVLMYVNDMVSAKMQPFRCRKINNAIRFIRIKNTFSCIGDLHSTPRDLKLTKKLQIAKDYKRQNKQKIIFSMPPSLFFVSLIYTLPGVVHLYILTYLLRLSR